MAIVPIEEFLAYGNLKEARVDGQMVQGLLGSAERFVQNYTRRRFAPEPALASNGADSLTPVTKTFIVTRGRRVIRIPDLRTATAVTLDGLSMVTDTYEIDSYAEPATSLRLVTPYGTSTAGWVQTTGSGRVAITGRWGWNPVPEDVQHAIKALTMRMYKEREAAWGDSIALPDGSVLSYFRALPASVQGALQLYRTPNLAFV